MSELPRGWMRGTLGDFVAPHRVSVDPASVPHLSYLGLEHVQPETTVILTSASASTVRSTSVRFSAGSTLYSRLRPYLNKVCAPDFDGIGSSEFIVFPPAKQLAPGFLKYLLNQQPFVEFTGTLDTGDRPRVSWENIRDFPCALPPRAEQERIVAAIEEHFSRRDAGVAALESARQKLKRMRAAILQTVIDRYPAETWKELRNVISTLDQGWSPRCEQQASLDEASWAVIKTTAVQAMGFDPGANKRLPANLAPREQHEIATGDLLVTRAGPRARAGVCCLVRTTRRRLMACDKVYRVRVNSRVAWPAYVEIALNAPSIVATIDSLKTGISDSGVNLTQETFQALTIPIPSLKDQRATVASVMEALEHVARLDDSLVQAHLRAGRLRSATLAEAFSGRLVHQDPSNEPAAVLLDRIAAERAASNRRVTTIGHKSRTPRR